MYGEADLDRAERASRRARNAALAMGAAALLAVVAGMALRIKPLALAAAIAGGWAVYGWCALKLAPWSAYLKFLREMSAGLRREARGAFVSAGAEPRMVDGVMVRDVLLDTGGDVPQLFYWDEEKPMPDFAPGQRVRFAAFGKFVTGCDSEPSEGG